MEIDASDKRATMSVGEFASFSPYAKREESKGLGAWRAAVGQQWHQEVQSHADSEGFENEQSISGEIPWHGWTLQLKGRIDQIRVQNNELHAREIKTVSGHLPLDRDSIAQKYKDYCLQLLSYRELLQRSKRYPFDSFRIELYLIEFSTGITQSFILDASFDHLIVDQLDRVTDYLDQKRERLEKLRSLKFKSAYATPRQGQETIQSDLKSAFNRSRIVLLEAPTGYGKTGVSWEHGLHKLASGEVERIIYLTSKKTGQLEAIERLNMLLADQYAASYWHIRNKEEHCVNSEFRCSSKICPYLSDLERKWDTAALQPLILAEAKPPPLEQFKTTNAADGICPYEAMRTALSYRDIWVADYNYLFSSSSSRLLGEQPDFDPAKTFLIIDEAHNLPSRVESNSSKELRSLALEALASELTELGADNRLSAQMRSLADECSAYGKGDTLSLRQLDDIADSLMIIVKSFANQPIDYDSISPESMDTLWGLAYGSTAMNERPECFLGWIPENGILKITCIDASTEIRRTLEAFHSCLFLTATLHPIDGFLEQTGLDRLDQTPIHLSPPAPWLNKAYDVAIDMRVDTRFKYRDKSIPTTVSTIAQLADRIAPIAVFFPSYAYADKVKQQLEETRPFYRIASQTRKQLETIEDRAAFIDEALRFSDIIFLTLGSSFAEGVDMLGGKIKAVMVVSPALPEVNPVQQYKREYYKNRNQDGFERAYLQPGIQKVNQALGRLVRAPGQSVKALLQCHRFADTKTRSLLANQYRECNYIFNDDDLNDWLERESQINPPQKI